MAAVSESFLHVLLVLLVNPGSVGLGDRTGDCKSEYIEYITLAHSRNTRGVMENNATVMARHLLDLGQGPNSPSRMMVSMVSRS